VAISVVNEVVVVFPLVFLVDFLHLLSCFDMPIAQLSNGASRYSLKNGAAIALDSLLQVSFHEIPNEFRYHAKKVNFCSIDGEGRISLPCPVKETEAVSALKAVEAGAIAALTDLRYDHQDRNITLDLERAATFLFAAYISTVGGMGKGDPNVKSKLIGISCFYTTRWSH